MKLLKYLLVNLQDGIKIIFQKYCDLNDNH